MATVASSTIHPANVISPAAAPRRQMSVEEFLALPDNGVDRDLVRGELREWGMTVRNRSHSITATRLIIVLGQWWAEIMAGRGELHSGEVGCYLEAGGTLVGIDVAYFDQAAIDRQPPDRKLLIGPPVLAVEVLSPNDTVEKVKAKQHEYLSAGVQQLWVVDPYDRVVVVHRPQQLPVLYTQRDELLGEPELPGLRVVVGAIFE